MKKVIGTVEHAYSLFEKAASSLQSPLLLAVRLYWGWQFFQTGFGKLTSIDKVVDFFTSLGIPFPAFNAYLIGSLQCVRRIMLFLDLGSTIISLPLSVNLLVAYITTGREACSSIF